jgi:hypothetical protein
MGVYTVTGIFRFSEDAVVALHRLHEILDEEDVGVLATSEEDLRVIPTTDDMAPVGGVIGGTIAGTLGLGVGLTLPGIGPVTAMGAAAAAVLGALAGFAGWKAGDAADRRSNLGVPADELFVYEDALRQGRIVVVVLTEDKDRHDAAREILAAEGAESLDAARQNWWVGLRDAEEAAYEAPDGEFARIEADYRTGFEAALAPWGRERSFDDAARELRTRYGAVCDQPAFQRGYARGQLYLRRSNDSSAWKRGGHEVPSRP